MTRDRVLEQVAAWEVGALVEGRYRIVELIARGGMGTVFRVEHERLGRQFAIKTLGAELREQPYAIAAFEREMRGLRLVRSQHVVDVSDCGHHAGAPYFVMELLEGKTLRQLLASEGILSPDRASRLCIDVCRALAKVHGAGLVHRDVKPENIYITQRDGGTESAKLLDFGLIGAIHHDDGADASPLVGTARYMSPERITRNAQIGPTSDVFSLGAVLYECLCGSPAFAGDTQEHLQTIMAAEFVPIEQLRSGIPSTLRAAVHRALRVQPTQRHASAQAFAAALEPHVSRDRYRHVIDEERLHRNEQRTAPMATSGRALFRRSRRHGFALLAIALGVLVSSGGDDSPAGDTANALKRRREPPVTPYGPSAVVAHVHQALQQEPSETAMLTAPGSPIRPIPHQGQSNLRAGATKRSPARNSQDDWERLIEARH